MVVIGVSCGGAFLLCLLSVSVTRHYKKRGKKNARHFSDGIPTDATFPNAEKYEMREKILPSLRKLVFGVRGKIFSACV